MKKTALYVMTAMLSLAFFPDRLEAADSNRNPVKTEVVEIKDPRKPGEVRTSDIQDLDKQMKQEVDKAMAEQRDGGGVVIISGTALLIIIILLIILL
jgi:hypothetical protein